MTKHIHIHLGPTKTRDKLIPDMSVWELEKLVKDITYAIQRNQGNRSVNEGLRKDAVAELKKRKVPGWGSQDTDYSKWYSASLKKPFAFGESKYPVGTKVEARRSDKAGQWYVKASGGYFFANESDLTFNEKVGDASPSYAIEKILKLEVGGRCAIDLTPFGSSTDYDATVTRNASGYSADFSMYGNTRVKIGTFNAKSPKELVDILEREKQKVLARKAGGYKDANPAAQIPYQKKIIAQNKALLKAGEDRLRMEQEYVTRMKKTIADDEKELSALEKLVSQGI